MRTGLLTVMLATLAVVSLGSSAGAHTSLISSSPSDQETVVDLSEVRLEFSDDLLEIGASLVLIHEGTTEYDLQLTRPSPRVVVGAAPDVPRGTYEVRWRVVAEDGHPIEGTLTFWLDPEVNAEPQPSASRSWTPTPRLSPDRPPATDDAVANAGLSPLLAAGLALIGAAVIAAMWWLTTRARIRREGTEE